MSNSVPDSPAGFGFLPRPTVLLDAMKNAEVASAAIGRSEAFAWRAARLEQFERIAERSERLDRMAKRSEEVGQVARGFDDRIGKMLRASNEGTARAQRGIAELDEATRRKIRREVELEAATLQMRDELLELNDRVEALVVAADDQSRSTRRVIRLAAVSALFGAAGAIAVGIELYKLLV